MATAAAPGRLIRTRHALRPAMCAQAAARPMWLALLTAIALAAAALRLAPWLAIRPLHHDEALYGTWARLIASGQDPFLLVPWVDKPPLTIYLIAGSFRLFGVSELALRLPGMVAGLLTVWATYGLALKMDVAACCVQGAAPRWMKSPRSGIEAVRKPPLRSAGFSPWELDRLKPRLQPQAAAFSGQRAALLAAALVALSPFAVLFAPTAFTDPWLTLWLVIAAWAALSERPLVAGLVAGLAVASKQQGVLVIPLVLALLIARGANVRRTLGQVALAVLGFALVFCPLTWWDSLRWHNRPSFWERSLDTYGGLGLAAPAAWSGRAAAWAEPLGYLFGTPVLSALVLGLALWGGLSRARPRAILALYTAGYLLLHVVVTFHPWDRYLLPILPLVCVLAAQGWRSAVDVAQSAGLRWQRTPQSGGFRYKRGLTAVALAAIIGYAAWLGAAGRIPVGSDYGAYRGVDRAAAALAALPADAVIYHRSLGWHLDFYLFNAPQERRWYDGAQKLADDAGRTASAEPGRPQWLVLPAWETPAAEDLRVLLATRDLRLVTEQQVVLAGGQVAFTLYRLAPLAGGGS